MPETKEVTTDLLPKPTNMKEYVEKQPYILSQDETPQDEKDVSPVEDKIEKKDDIKEPLVSSGKDLSGLEKKESPKIKIGDLEYTEAEWIEKHGVSENFATREQKLREWQGNNVKQSQLLKNLTDVEIKSLLPYALSQKKVPDGFYDNPSDFYVNLPESFKMQDELGDEVEVKLSDIPKDVIEKMAQKAFNEYYPELTKEKDKIKELTDQNVELKTANEQKFSDAGKKASVNFMKENPQFAITFYEGDDIEDVIKDVLLAGETHPEYFNAQRFLHLGNYTVQNGGTLDDSLKVLYGDSIKKEKIKNKIQDNQDNAFLPEKGKVSAKTEDQVAVDKAKDPRTEKMQKIGLI